MKDGRRLEQKSGSRIKCRNRGGKESGRRLEGGQKETGRGGKAG